MMMSPSLALALGLSDASNASLEQPIKRVPIMCELCCAGKEKTIRGRLLSLTLLPRDSGFTVSLSVPHASLEDALSCPEFETMVIFIDGNTPSSRAIKSTWEQTREVIPDERAGDRNIISLAAVAVCD